MKKTTVSIDKVISAVQESTEKLRQIDPNSTLALSWLPLFIMQNDLFISDLRLIKHINEKH